MTLIHRGAGISDSVKYWIKPNIENRIKNGEIAAHFHSKVVRITPETIQVATRGGEITIANDFVFALVGYQPDLKFLNATGISLEPDTRRPRTVRKRWKARGRVFTWPEWILSRRCTRTRFSSRTDDFTG